MTSSVPCPPFVVAEGLDISIFSSLEDAQSWLEPWWVEEKRGRVYDSQGRLLQLEADSAHVRISLGESEPAHAAELESLLRSFLQATSMVEGFDKDCGLPCLVEVCRKAIHGMRFHRLRPAPRE